MFRTPKDKEQAAWRCHSLVRRARAGGVWRRNFAPFLLVDVVAVQVVVEQALFPVVELAAKEDEL